MENLRRSLTREREQRKQALEREREALEQQTATSDILRVISSSPTDIQPVLDAVAESAARLCECFDAEIFRREGDRLLLVAHHGPIPSRALVVPLVREAFNGRTVLDGRTFHVADLQAETDEFPRGSQLAQQHGTRAQLSVPLMREGVAIGTISLRRTEARLFTERQVALLQTFADQAVIAIENARLFNETKEALERQTATSEILRVISQSPTDVQPVFDAILAAAMTLCHANVANVYTFDGELIHLAALVNRNPEYGEAIRQVFPRPPGRDTAVGRAVLVRDVVEIPDVLEDREYGIGAQTLAGGFRSVLAVPLIREERPIGAIIIGGPEPGPFPEKQVALLKSFADQAVIAIENVRLFNETKEALERQTATSEILRVISGSPSDLGPVFQSISRRFTTLCGAAFSGVFTYDGQLVHYAGGEGFTPERERSVRARYPVPVDEPSLISARTIYTRTVVHVEDVLSDPHYDATRAAVLGVRRILGVPMLRDGVPLGALVAGWAEAGATPKHHEDVLKTFADQAVIAIENVRLFNETKEALEKQTATAEILSVISGTPTDTQPVFEAIVRRAKKLCDAVYANVYGYDGERLHWVTSDGWPSDLVSVLQKSFPAKPDRSRAAGRAVLDKKPVHVEDTRSDPDYDPDLATRLRYRRILAVPLLRSGEVVGVITIRWAEPGLIEPRHEELLKTFAAQAVIAIENVRLFNETKEALERQTATAEILRVMSSSPSDVQPVFDAVARKTSELCNGNHAIVVRFDGELIHLVAQFNARPGADQPTAQRYPRRPGRETPSSRAILERAVVHVPYADKDPDLSQDLVHRIGAGSFLCVPLLREGGVIGAIGASRAESGPFPAKQIELVKVFADQAVIAIENARLFKELQTTNATLREALEQRTATAEILRVISSSPSDLKPVFDTILDAALHLCEAQHGQVYLYDGAAYDLVDSRGADQQATEPFRHIADPGPHTGLGRILKERRPVHIPDLLADAATGERDPVRMRTIEALGARTFLAVPLLKDDKVMGALVIYRREVQPFDDQQVALIQTFAAQAVIAIENVRLFNETKEALEQQTATAEILKVIASSPTDVQPVFDAIAERAAILCGAKIGVVTKFDGELLHLVAFYGASPELVEPIRALYPLRPGSDTTTARAVRDAAPAQIPDLLADADYVPKEESLQAGYRSNVAVPLMREDKVIGAISVARAETGVFSAKEIDLLETFADQAVIAIENARLFKELQERTEALTRSVDQLTALGEVGQAISSTLDLETVLKTIVSRAVQLTGLDAGGIYEYDAATEQFHLRAAENISEEMLEVLRSTPIRKGDGAVGGTAVALEPIQIPETQNESYKSQFRDLIIRTGRRALLAVPLMHEEEIVGALTVQRNTPGPFAPEVVDLLKTFATQSALAIQNARLFREIAEKGKQLEVASHHKSQFLASMSHELRTPLNAILGFNEMMLDGLCGEVPGGFKDPLDETQKSGKHLLRLINNVLDLAKIEAGRMELALADYSVHDTVESVRSTLRPLAAEKGLEFLANVPADIPLAYGDAGRITQCLMNLAGNSLKFTKEGRVEISVQQQNGQLRYRVADTGIGIPPESIGSLFTEFKQTDATIASEYGGTGLGLSITKKFIEMHGGRIWVESEIGKGSAFIFEIPLKLGK